MKKIIIVLTSIILTSCTGQKDNNDASGTFEAVEIIVSAEASGKIMEFNVEEGKRLNAGQQLGFIDTIQLYLKKMQLLSSIKAVNNRQQDVSKQIAAIIEQIETQKREKERTERLISANAANKKQLDDINSQIAILEKQLSAQSSTLERGNKSITEESSALEIQVAQIDDQLNKSKITAPISGTVLVKYAEPHEITAIGKPLFKIADTGNMILRAYIVSGQISQVKTGQTVKVLSDYGDSGVREYAGTITWVSEKAEFTPKTIQTKDERANLVYAVKIAVKNDGFLKIGMYGDIKFE